MCDASIQNYCFRNIAVGHAVFGNSATTPRLCGWLSWGRDIRIRMQSAVGLLVLSLLENGCLSWTRDEARSCALQRLGIPGVMWKVFSLRICTRIILMHCRIYFTAHGNSVKEQPFQLYGPKGTQTVADGILQVLRTGYPDPSRSYRKAPPQGATINVHEIQEGVVYEKPGEVKVTAFLVDHKPVEPAFGYRFDAGQK